MSLPDARADGMCADCTKSRAVTKDGRFCIKCLRKMLRDVNPIDSPMRDDIGRKSASSKSLGGTAEMGTDGDDW